MDRGQALHSFWGGFGLPAYDESSVPTGDDAPDFPYLTYGVALGSFGDDVAATGSIWYRGSSWEDASRKADEVSRAIGLGGKTLPVDDGFLWIKRGAPFIQRMGDASDDKVKRIVLTVSIESVTAY